MGKNKKEVDRLNKVLDRITIEIGRRDRKVFELSHDRRLLNETTINKMIYKEDDKLLASLRSILGM